MGTVHKFKHRPKDERQFRAYRPRPPQTLDTSAAPRPRVGDWQRSALAWLVLVVLAVGIWAAGALIGDA